MKTVTWCVISAATLVSPAAAWAQGASVDPTPAAIEPAPAIVVPTAAAPTSEPAVAPAPVSPATPAASAFPAYFQPALNMQGWVTAEQIEDASTTTAKLRRAEIYFKGSIVPERVKYLLMVDLARVLEPKETIITVDHQEPTPAAGAPAESVKVKQSKGAVSVLQDYYMQLVTEYADLYFGQFKIPVAYDASQTSATDLVMPDRSVPSIYFADRRDIGFKATKKFKYLRYTVGLFNGNGQGALDNNAAKDVALRLDLLPMDGLSIGAVAYYTLAQVRTKAASDRYEADVHLDKYGVYFQAEYLRSNVAKDGDFVQGHGTYAMVGYRVLEELLPMVRVAYLDPNLDAEITDDDYKVYELGVTWYAQKNQAKLQATVGRVDYADAAKPAATQLIVGAQLSY